jgi:hypothetical protein
VSYYSPAWYVCGFGHMQVGESMALFEAVSNRIRRGWFKGEPAPDVALTREHSWSPAGGLAFRTCVATMSKGQGETLALILIGMLGLSGCATSRPEMAWVRTDGRRILDDPALLSKGETDIALCNANPIAARSMKERVSAWG